MIIIFTMYVKNEINYLLKGVVCLFIIAFKRLTNEGVKVNTDATQ